MAAGGRCGAAGRALPAALLLLLLLLGAAASPRSSSCHHRPPGRGEVRPGREGAAGGLGLGGGGRAGREGEAAPTAVLPAAGGVRRAPGRGSPRQEGRGAAAAD